MKDKQQIRNIDEPHYTYWQALWMSFGSRKLYLDVCKRWQGLGLIYLLIAIAVIAAPFGVKMCFRVHEFLKHELIEPINLIPPLKFENGLLQTKETMPWEIKNKEGKVKVIIDSTGKFTHIDPKVTPNLRILIKENTFSLYLPRIPVIKQYASTADTEILEQPFTPEMTGTIIMRDVIDFSWMLKYSWLIIFFIWPISIGALYGFYVSIILMIAMMGQIVSQAIYKFPLTYAQACRLLIVGGTPTLTSLGLALYFNNLIPYLSGSLIILLAIYFSYAVIVNRRDSKKLVRR